jgi:predicted DNA-binding ribbon-helix-helix protein
MKSTVIKRSIGIDGHKTSISLEDAFWNILKDIAHERGESISHLLTSINAKRQSNLSSSVRLFVLEFYKEQLDRFEHQKIPVQRRKRRSHRVGST